MIRRLIQSLINWLVADLPQPLTVSEMSRMGRQAQLRTLRQKQEAKHAQLREELGIKS